MKINGGKIGKIDSKTKNREYRYFRRRKRVDVFAFVSRQFVETKVFDTVAKAKSFMLSA